MAMPLRRAAMAVQPAKLISRKGHLIPGQFYVQELFFEVPKNYAKPEAGTLTLFGRSVAKYEKPIVGPSLLDGATCDKPYFVYFEGGPGFGNHEPQDHPLARWALSRGYQMLYLDYRGTGLSTPINVDALLALGGPQKQADYLKLFRADSIVRDFEAVRQYLTADFPEERKKWSSFGQSYGGFVTLTYLSFFPEGLRECFATGGLAPVRRTAEEVYRATFKKVVQRNEAYYKKYPEDVERVHRVANNIIEKGGIALPSGGTLTVPRLLSMGLAFGAHGGLDSVHSIMLKADADLQQFGFLTRSSLQLIELQNPFDTNPIYAILHEPIYCYKKGVASNWAALAVGKELEKFAWLAEEPKSTKEDNNKTPLYFSGEMVYPFHFETYPELARIKEAADILAAYDEWEPLYDESQLRANEVPVYEAVYVDDMYVDFELSRETGRIVRGIQVFETNALYHNAVRVRTEDVLAQLFKMRDDTID